MDNTQHAVCGQRMPPEWSWELPRVEQRPRADQARRVRYHRAASAQRTERPGAMAAYRVLDSDQVFEHEAADLTCCFLAASQPLGRLVRLLFFFFFLLFVCLGCFHGLPGHESQRHDDHVVQGGSNGAGLVIVGVGVGGHEPVDVKVE